MKYFLLVLLAALAANASAQQFPVEHAEQARQESLAMAQRTALTQKDAHDRRNLQYAENRSRCETALQAARQRGKVPTFSCGEHGFSKTR